MSWATVGARRAEFEIGNAQLIWVMVFPVSAVAPPAAFVGVKSRGVQQRFCKRRATEEKIFETTRALNLLAGFETPVVCSSSELSATSRAVRSQVSTAVAEAGPPGAVPCPQEAGSMLLGHSSGPYHQQAMSASGAAAVFARPAIAWPALGSKPGSISDRVPSHLSELLEGRSDGLVRTTKEVREIRRRDGLPNMHGDPTLTSNRPDYIWFVREGVKRGIFRFGKKAKEHCRAFFVKKKTTIFELSSTAAAATSTSGHRQE